MNTVAKESGTLSTIPTPSVSGGADSFEAFASGRGGLSGSEFRHYITTHKKRPPTFLIDGVIGSQWTCVFGKSKSLKSMFMLQATVALASGQSDLWGNSITRRGLSVCYFLNEEFWDEEIFNRLESLEPSADAWERIRVQHAPQFIEGSRGDDCWGEAAEVAKDFDVIVIDNMRGLNGDASKWDEGHETNKVQGRLRQVAKDKPLIAVAHSTSAQGRSDKIAHSYGFEAFFRADIRSSRKGDIVTLNFEGNGPGHRNEMKLRSDEYTGILTPVDGTGVASPAKKANRKPDADVQRNAARHCVSQGMNREQFAEYLSESSGVTLGTAKNKVRERYVQAGWLADGGNGRPLRAGALLNSED